MISDSLTKNEYGTLSSWVKKKNRESSYNKEHNYFVISIITARNQVAINMNGIGLFTRAKHKKLVTDAFLIQIRLGSRGLQGVWSNPLN